MCTPATPVLLIKGDSAASSHYLSTQDSKILQNIKQNIPPI